MELDQALLDDSPVWNQVVDIGFSELPVYMKRATVGKHSKKLHTQPGLEIGISHEGRAAMVVGKDIFMQARRHLIVVPGRIPHQLFPDTATTYKRTVICLDNIRFKEAVGGAVTADLDLDWLSALEPCHLQLDVHTYAALDALSRLIGKEMKERRDGWRTVVLSQTCVMAVMLKRIIQSHLAKSEELQKRKPQPLSDHVRLCADYVANHLHEDLSLQKMAKMFSVSPEHLTRSFRREKGAAFYQYVLMARVSESKRLLGEQPELSISEIAYSLGFSSSSQFNRVFKSVVLMTPTAYRLHAAKR